MQFDNLPSNPYLNIVSSIIREGIIQCIPKLNNSDNEDLKNQLLTETFNKIGTVSEELWIGVSKENNSIGKQTREDIYFYLNDDRSTRVFYVEGKRLPKYNTQFNEEYVIGKNNSGNPSGGIERFRKGIHGEANRIIDNALIGYIENNSIEYWLRKVNESISLNFNSDEILNKKEKRNNEYISSHQFELENKLVNFRLHHFWINLINK